MSADDKNGEHPIEDLVAGNAFRDSLLSRADVKEPFPLWHGWAIMDAFLAGLKHARSAQPSSTDALRDWLDTYHPDLLEKFDSLPRPARPSAIGTPVVEALREAITFAIRLPNDQFAYHRCRLCDGKWWGEKPGRDNPERPSHRTDCAVLRWEAVLRAQPTETRQTWIPVEERLPEKEGWYLTWCEVGSTAHLCIWQNYFKEGKWSGVEVALGSAPPTHWQPLPSVPAEGGTLGKCDVCGVDPFTTACPRPPCAIGRQSGPGGVR